MKKEESSSADSSIENRIARKTELFRQQNRRERTEVTPETGEQKRLRMQKEAESNPENKEKVAQITKAMDDPDLNEALAQLIKRSETYKDRAKSIFKKITGNSLDLPRINKQYPKITVWGDFPTHVSGELDLRSPDSFEKIEKYKLSDLSKGYHPRLRFSFEDHELAIELVSWVYSSDQHHDRDVSILASFHSTEELVDRIISTIAEADASDKHISGLLDLSRVQ